MDLIKVFVLIWLGCIGAAFGSFACCQAWRLHISSEESDDKKKDKKISKSSQSKRSICMHCGYRLSWYDNIPVLSWVLLRGKCRKCHKFIGWSEILSEVAMAIIFVLLGLMMWGNFWLLGVLLVIMTLLWILTIYDAKWSELPVSILVAVNIISVIFFVLSAMHRLGIFNGIVGFDTVAVPHDFNKALFSICMEAVMGIAFLSGTYYFLYLFSKEKWVGGGDWILCLAIALILGSWKLAMVELFISNVLALIVAMPGAVTKKNRQVPFGPFLVIGFVIVFLASDYLLDLMSVFTF